MKILKDRILKDGRCYPGGILKVDNFINHQMDPILMKSMVWSSSDVLPPPQSTKLSR